MNYHDPDLSDNDDINLDKFIAEQFKDKCLLNREEL